MYSTSDIVKYYPPCTNHGFACLSGTYRMVLPCTGCREKTGTYLSARGDVRELDASSKAQAAIGDVKSSHALVR